MKTEFFFGRSQYDEKLEQFYEAINFLIQLRGMMK